MEALTKKQNLSAKSKQQKTRPESQLHVRKPHQQQSRQGESSTLRITKKDVPTAPIQDLSAEEKAQYEQLLAQKNSEAIKIRLEWQEETRNLKKENGRLREENIDLIQKVSHLELARDMRAADGDPWEHEFYRKNKEIYELEKKVSIMRNQMHFIPDSSTLNSSPSRDVDSAIQSTMEFLQAELESILHGHDTSIPLQVPTKIRSIDLNTLIRSIHSTGVEGGEQKLLRQWSLKFEPDMVIKPLVLAALREWVFAPTFPVFTSKNTRLLDAYRRALMSQGNLDTIGPMMKTNDRSDGWRNLHNLELAAYHSLIEDQDLQDRTIPFKAKEHATRLSAALAVLFCRTPLPMQQQNPSPAFEMWGQSQRVSEARHHRLIALFQSALRLKARIITIEHDFEFLVYPPGTTQTLGSNSECEFWIHASIHTYGRKPSGSRGDMADALIRPNNFVRNSFSYRERLEASLSINYIFSTKEQIPSACAVGENHQRINNTNASEKPNRAAGKTVRDSEDDEYVASSPCRPVPKARNGTIKRATAPSDNPASAKKQRTETFTCETCQKEYSSRETLKRHIETSNSSSSSVDVCAKSSSRNMLKMP
jgi:hypothetical protein